jgi:hypothetical protein
MRGNQIPSSDMPPTRKDAMPTQPIKNTGELVNEVLEAILPDDAEGYITPELYVHRMPTHGAQEMNIRLYVPVTSDTNDTDLVAFAYDLVTTALSEFTNNDACDVCLRVRSGHFDLHPDLPTHIRESDLGDYAVIDAFVLDSLT